MGSGFSCEFIQLRGRHSIVDTPTDLHTLKQVKKKQFRIGGRLIRTYLLGNDDWINKPLVKATTESLKSLRYLLKDPQLLGDLDRKKERGPNYLVELNRLGPSISLDNQHDFPLFPFRPKLKRA